MRAAGRAVAVILLSAWPADRLTAQDVVVGPQVVFGDYRETSADLRFRGVGVGAAATLTWKKLAVDVAASSVEYEPADDGAATVTFQAKQLDVRVRYYVAGPVSAELGFVNRDTDPEFEAQSVGAVRAGVRASYLLGPGVRMGLRGGLLFGAEFSGGGTTSPVGALELGLAFGVDALRGRLRFTGDYEFQRIGRTTDDGSGEVDVPIQQSLGRVGIAVAF